MGWPEMSYMRSAVSQVYRGDKWKEKVRVMPDRQVIALYFSFYEKGMFDCTKPNVGANARSCQARSECTYDPSERFNDESDRDYYDRINHEL